ncbi:hypothetical protein BDR26DRAFT_71554 [Obelidium mucronatum]|nr:hypothetical protein BDR26DRAFT_71554 [Obelidium mucronatum]
MLGHESSLLKSSNITFKQPKIMTSASYAPSSASTAATSTTVLTSASVRRRQSFLGIFTSPPRESHEDRRASHKATPRNDLLSLLDSGSGSDVTLIVGSDRVQFTAHCLILRTRSDFFKAQLPASAVTNSGSLTQLIVELPFLDPDAFRIVLRYIYSLEEDDEATSLDTEDWRLVLACYQAAHHISLNERADIYLQVFTHIFSINDPSTSQGREAACDMWAAASSLSWRGGCCDCMCTRVLGFIRAPLLGLVMRGWALLADNNLWTLSLPVLIRVLNAIPEHLESAVGRFRIIKSWFMAQKTLGMFDDEEEDEGFMVGKHYDDCLASPVSDYGDIVRPFSPPTTPTQTPSRLAESNIGTPSSKTSSTVATAFVSSAAPVLKSKGKLQQSPFSNCYSLSQTSHYETAIEPSTSNSSRKNEKSGTLNVSLAQQTALQALQLPSLTAADILREIEPADILPQSHILSLYRTAASYAAKREHILGTRTKWFQRTTMQFME